MTRVEERERVIVRFAGDSGDGMQLAGGRFTDATVALGLVCWLYDRPTEVVEEWIEAKFEARPAVMEANRAAFRAGYAFGDTTEQIDVRYHVAPATDIAPGTYRTVNGNTATALGLIAAAQRSGLQLMLSSYPITPASELLHELARHAKHGVRTVQAEDEIAAAGIALGAAFGGALGVTATSGPGMDLKAETVGLAAALELPMIVIDVQRAGPSTGMPTKTEQSDLLMAIHGRHGESPLPVVAASTPGQCFEAAYEAARIAVHYRTPVILLSDLFLANSSEPWRIPDANALPVITPDFAEPVEAFQPYARDDKGARPWAVPGTPGLAHRIGGLEKQDVTGNISYDGANHARMTRIRADKVRGIAAELPPLEVDADDGAELLVLGWGSSLGAIRAAARRVRGNGHAIAVAHLRHLHPLPTNVGEVLHRYERVLVPEMNTGQLAHLLRAEFLVDVEC